MLLALFVNSVLLSGSFFLFSLSLSLKSAFIFDFLVLSRRRGLPK